MNIKKVFASLTGVLMLATTVTPLVTGAAHYGAELEGAYAYAYSKGITTMPSIDSANMYGEVTRGQLAKMISNWAEAELGKTVDATKVCSFTDEGTAGGDLAMYLKKACQMGLMGQGVAQFRPNDKVTRGEFGTTLSRALWGSKYEGGNPYYVNHLAALRDAGIMTRIETPAQLEIRGYVMLMLQRAVTKKDAANCADPIIALACSVGGETCPAHCNKKTPDTRPDVDTEKKAGDLTVSITNKTDKIVSIPGTATAILGKVKFAGSEKITLASVNVSRVGLGDNTLIKNVWFERNGQRVSNKATITADNQGVIRFNRGFEVMANETLDFVVEFQDSVGGEYAFRLTDIDSSAKNVVLNPDTTSTFRTTEYRVAQLEANSLDGDLKSEYRINGNNAYDLGRFTLYNESPIKEDRVIRVQNLNFRNKKDGELTNFKDWTILRDGKKIDAKVVVDGKYVTFFISDTILASKLAIYTIMAVPTDIQNEEGDKYQLELRNSGDIVAVEEGNSEVAYRVLPFTVGETRSTRVTRGEDHCAKDLANKTNLDLCINQKLNERVRNFDRLGVLNTTWKAVSAKEVTIKGGHLILSRDSKFPSTVIAGEGYSNVVLAKGKLTVNQGVKLNELILTQDSNARYAQVNLNDVIKRAWISIGGKRYSSVEGKQNGIYASQLVFDTDFYLAQGVYDIELIVNLNKDILKKYGNELKKPVKLQNIHVNNFDPHGGNYTNGDEVSLNLNKDGIGLLPVAELYVRNSSVSLTKTSSNASVKVVAGHGGEEVLFKGKLRNNFDREITLNDLVVTAPNGATTGNKLANVAVKINGQVVSSVIPYEFTQGVLSSVTIPSVTATLKPAETVDIELVGYINGSITAGERLSAAELKISAFIDGNKLESSAVRLSNLEFAPDSEIKPLSNSAGANLIAVESRDGDIVAASPIYSDRFAVNYGSDTLRAVVFGYTTADPTKADFLNAIEWKNFQVTAKKKGDSQVRDLTIEGRPQTTTGVIFKQEAPYAAVYIQNITKDEFANEFETAKSAQTLDTFKKKYGIEEEISAKEKSDIEGASTVAKFVEIALLPEAFERGEYEVFVNGNIAWFETPVQNVELVDLVASKVVFNATTTEFKNFRTHFKKLFVVDYPVLKMKDRVSNSTNHYFTLEVSKKTNEASLRVTKVYTVLKDTAASTFPTEESEWKTDNVTYNSVAVSETNPVESTNVDDKLDIIINGGDHNVKVMAIDFEVTDSRGNVTKYTKIPVGIGGIVSNSFQA